MQIQFTVTPITYTLVNDTASPKITGVIESIGGQDILQKEPLYGSASPALFARGNISGHFAFSAGCSFASYALAAAALKTAYALIDSQGSCVLNYGGTTLTFPNAILQSVQRVEWQGVRLVLRYTFEITSIV